MTNLTSFVLGIVAMDVVACIEVIIMTLAAKKKIKKTIIKWRLNEFTNSTL